MDVSQPATYSRLQIVLHWTVAALVVFHTAGYVNSRPPERVWRINALAPRVVVEAAAAEGVRRVVITSTVAA